MAIISALKGKWVLVTGAASGIGRSITISDARKHGYL